MAKTLHEVAKMRFTLSLDGKNFALLQYSKPSPNIYDLHHTEVPPVYRGKGVGNMLVTQALDIILAEKAQFLPTCSFVRKVVDENASKYGKAVAKI